MDFDVIVVGGGPGGSTTAAFLASKYNKRVLLLEKEQFPRDKPCGDAISGKSMSVLADLGIKTDVEDTEHLKTYGVILSSPKGTTLEIPFKSKDPNRHNYGYVCKRFVYDNVLFQHAKSSLNVTTIEKFQVNDLLYDGQHIVGIKGKDLNSGNEREFYAKVVVGADGANGFVAGKLGVAGFDDAHRVIAVRAYYDGIVGMKPAIEIHFVKSLIPGYFWIFPLEPGYCNVGIGMVNTDYNKAGFNMKDKMFEVIEKNFLFKDRFAGSVLEEGSIKGWTLPVGSKRRKAHGNGFVLIGDAAGLIDPFTGEGIANAMTSGQIASEWVDKAIKENNVSETFFKQYEDEVWSVLGPKMATSYKLQKMGRKKFLTNLVISKAAKSKQIQQALASMLDNKEQRKKLANPLFYLKLLFA